MTTATATTPETNKPQLASVHGVEIFQAGEHREGSGYTRADLDEMASNFAKLRAVLKPTVAVGHEENQTWLEDTGYPAAGTVTDLRNEMRPCGYCDGSGQNSDRETCQACRGKGELYTAVADFEDVPPVIAGLINGRSYQAVSAEVYPKYQTPDGVQHGKALRRVALLGSELPQVKTLAELPKAYFGDDGAAQFCRPAHRRGLLKFNETRPSKAGTVHYFSEMKPMPATKRNRVQKFSDAANKIFLRFACEKFADAPADEKDKKAGEVYADADSDGMLPEGSAPPPEGVDSAAMKKLLLEYGFTEEELAGIPDTGLAGIVRVYKTAMAQQATAPEEFESAGQKAMWAKVTAAGEKEDAGGRSIYDPRGMKGNWSEDVGGATNGRDPSQITLKFGEKTVNIDRVLQPIVQAAVAAAVKPINDGLAATKNEVDKFHETTKRGGIDAKLDELVKAGKVLPAELDPADPDNLRAQLYRANAIEKFSDGRTELDKQLAVLAKRPALVKFSEQVRGKGSTKESADAEVAKVEQHYEQFSETFEKYGHTKEKRLEAFQLAKKRNPKLTADEYLRSA